MYFHFELELIRWIHTFRTEMFDSFFLFLNYFDRIEFLLIALPIALIFGGWKRAYEVLLLLFISSVINVLLKALFDSPRPLHLDEVLGLIRSSSGGFPSGAAQNVMILSWMLIDKMRSRWKWLIVLPYALLIPFSRLYLGAHFVSDLLGGFAIGYLIYRGYRLLAERKEESFGCLFTLSLLFFGAVYWFLPFFRLYALITFSATLLVLLQTKSRLLSRLLRAEGAKPNEPLP